MVYLRCRNCGCYLLDSEVFGDGYCCSDCAEQYRTCANCGGHYQADMGYKGQYCCPDCSVQYKINRYPEAATEHDLLKELA
jgi:hypothetical protein